MVLSLEDFMVRRTSLYYKEDQNGWKVVPKLKTSFQKVLGWDDAKWESEVQAYKAYLDYNMGSALGRTYT
jgi:glycerol-3-phosphate dehydrogenase